MGFFSNIAKCLLFMANFVFLVCGILLIVFGAIYKINNAGLDIMSISSYTIAVGCIITLISFFGCYGAWNGNSCLLTTYAVILITIFIAQVVLGVLVFISIKNGDGELSTEVQKYLNILYNTHVGTPEFFDIIYSIQRNFKCCGVNGTNDEIVSNGTLLIGGCCEVELANRCTKENAFEDSCTTKLTEFLLENSKIIGGVAIGVAVFELVAAMFAFCVRNKNQGHHGKYV